METVDDDTAAAAIDFIRRQTKAGKPWFVWWSGTRMHFRTHVSPEKMAEIKKTYPNADEYTAGMIEHDMHIGQFLAVLDELGIADKTIVHYSTDNGPHMNTWPDAAMTPFRGEKNTNWEGGWRVPAAVRWPGVIKPGSCQQRHRPSHGLAADLPRRRRQDRHQGRPAGRLQVHRPSAGTTRSTSMATT